VRVNGPDSFFHLVPGRPEKRKTAAANRKRRTSGSDTSDPETDAKAERVEQKRQKLDEIWEKVKKGNKRVKYSSLTEFIYGSLKDLGGTAELAALYEHIDDHWSLLDKKCE
jgi:hypothetical protein